MYHTIVYRFDRIIFDAKNCGEDDEFFIIANAEEVAFEEEKNDTSRTLSFSLPPGTEEFEIFGTILFDESFLLKLEEIKEAVTTHCLNAAEKIRNDNQKTKKLTVFIRTSPFQKNNDYYAKAKNIDLPIETNDSIELIKQALNN